MKQLLTADEIDEDATEINEGSLCSSANKSWSEDEYFCENDEERDHYESPRKHGRLKEPEFVNNDDDEKLDGIRMILSANESTNDQISNKTLDYGNGMK